MAAVDEGSQAERVLASALTALVAAGASRHVVAAALSAGLRVATSLGSAPASGVEAEVEDRVGALRVVLTAQAEAAAAGRPQHTARGLVCADDLVMANAAKHQFAQSFQGLTPAGARREQRGKRRTRAPRRLDDRIADSGETTLLEDRVSCLELRVSSLEAEQGSHVATSTETSEPDAVGSWFAEEIDQGASAGGALAVPPLPRARLRAMRNCFGHWQRGRGAVDGDHGDHGQDAGGAPEPAIDAVAQVPVAGDSLDMASQQRAPAFELLHGRLGDIEECSSCSSSSGSRSQDDAAADAAGDQAAGPCGGLPPADDLGPPAPLSAASLHGTDAGADSAGGLGEAIEERGGVATPTKESEEQAHEDKCGSETDMPSVLSHQDEMTVETSEAQGAKNQSSTDEQVAKEAAPMLWGDIEYEDEDLSTLQIMELCKYADVVAGISSCVPIQTWSALAAVASAAPALRRLEVCERHDVEEPAGPRRKHKRAQGNDKGGKSKGKGKQKPDKGKGKDKNKGSTAAPKPVKGKDRSKGTGKDNDYFDWVVAQRLGVVRSPQALSGIPRDWPVGSSTCRHAVLGLKSAQDFSDFVKQDGLDVTKVSELADFFKALQLMGACNDSKDADGLEQAVRDLVSSISRYFGPPDPES